MAAQKNVCGFALGRGCDMPGTAYKRCDMKCTRAPQHVGRCACDFHEMHPHTRTPYQQGEDNPDYKNPENSQEPDLQIWLLTKDCLNAFPTLMVNEIDTVKKLKNLQKEQIENLLDKVKHAKLINILHGTEEKVTVEEDRGRQDFPVLRFATRGKKERSNQQLDTIPKKLKEREITRNLKYANSSKIPRDSTWNTWCYYAKEHWNAEPLPITVDLVEGIATSLRLGGYRSAAAYFSRAKSQHVMEFQQEPSAAVLKAIGDYTRACNRGIGPPKLKESFRFESF